MATPTWPSSPFAFGLLLFRFFAFLCLTNPFSFPFFPLPPSVSFGLALRSAFARAFDQVRFRSEAEEALEMPCVRFLQLQDKMNMSATLCHCAGPQGKEDRSLLEGSSAQAKLALLQFFWLVSLSFIRA